MPSEETEPQKEPYDGPERRDRLAEGPAAVMPSTRALDQRIRRRIALPPPPAALPAALAAIDGAEPSVDVVVGHIERDSSLATMVVRLTNSALYRPPTPIASVRGACTWLGLESLQFVLGQAAALDLLGGVPPRGRHDLAAMWRHGLRSALAAQELCALLPSAFGITADDAYGHGLLHDVGTALILRTEPATFELVVNEARDRNRSRVVIELETFGFTHAHVGAALIRSWHLGDALAESIGRHHDPIDADEPAITWLAALANSLAHEAEGDLPAEGNARSRRELLAMLGVTSRLDELVARLRCADLGMG